jgi:hypothetical protein
METTQAIFSHFFRENSVDEARKDAMRFDFDRRLKVEFHGMKVTSDAGVCWSLSVRRIGRDSDEAT